MHILPLVLFVATVVALFIVNANRHSNNDIISISPEKKSPSGLNSELFATINRIPSVQKSEVTRGDGENEKTERTEAEVWLKEKLIFEASKSALDASRMSPEHQGQTFGRVKFAESPAPKLSQPTANRPSPSKASSPSQVRVPMQVIISLVLLGASIYIILSHGFEPTDKHWAYGSAGTILGFWLKG